MSSLEERAEKVRQFNRFYTHRMGVLHEHLLESDYSLTEVRMLYELAHRPALTSVDLCRMLSLNAGYVSRVIGGFEKQGMVIKSRSADDARIAQLKLTDKGHQTFQPLNDASREQVMGMLRQLSEPEQDQLVHAMAQIQGYLGKKEPSGYLLREPQPGDMGWIVHRQGLLYASEYGWNAEFEALVAEIVAKYVQNFDPRSDRCWIAEKDGQVVGSIFVVRQDEATAKLRLLYVDANARGLGIGRRLVDECLRFARQAGYKKMVLWTNSVLVDARRIYEKAGFQLIEEEAHHSFGKNLVGQTWSIDL